MSKRWSDLLELRKHPNGRKNGGGEGVREEGLLLSFLLLFVLICGTAL